MNECRLSSNLQQKRTFRIRQHCGHVEIAANALKNTVREIYGNDQVSQISIISNMTLLISVFLCLASCSIKNETQALKEIAETCGVSNLKISPERRNGAILLDEYATSWSESHPDFPNGGFPRQNAIYSCVIPKATQSGIQVRYRVGTYVD